MEFGRGYYSYPISSDDKIKDKDALCHIVYSVKIKDSVDKFVGKFAEKKEALTTSKKYTDITKTTEPMWSLQAKDYVDCDKPDKSKVTIEVEGLKKISEEEVLDARA